MPVVDYLIARDGPPSRSGIAYDYVLAGDGLYVVAENDHLRVRIPVTRCPVRGLPPLHAECSLLHGRMPGEVWRVILRAARQLGALGQEILLAVRFDADAGYRLKLPPQVVGPVSVHYAPVEDAVLEFHSHGAGAARFSSTDNADERRMRLYGVVGCLDSPWPHVALRVGVYGYFLPIRWSSVFDSDPADVHDTNQHSTEDSTNLTAPDQAALDRWICRELSD